MTGVAFTGLGYRNSNGDNSEAIAAATRAACATPECSASLEQQARGSFGHEYSFKTEQREGGKLVPKQVIVSCERELVLLGEWRCASKGR